MPGRNSSILPFPGIKWGSDLFLHHKPKVFEPKIGRDTIAQGANLS